MKTVWVIAKRELSSFFDSLIAYIMLILFLGFNGFFTWLESGNDVFFSGQASLRGFFSIAFWTLFFFIPALTMRLLAEEKKTGTIELLLTKAVTDRQVVWGKFLAVFILIAIALLLTLPYVFTIDGFALLGYDGLGNLDLSATLSGYLGLLLMSAMYIGIGIFASSINNNQIVAFLMALLIGIFFQFIFGAMAGNATGWLGELFETLSTSAHFESIARGVIDTRDIIFFVSIGWLGLFLAEVSLTKRKVID
ncbi:ABC transporter permease [uncultured Microscilla sp.]|uniref:ABC transporter permease n=1 Tax=uncultured Microscilla sp. TaxID=432653 RepID=UPI002633AB79|nr:ABC transporter permease [uncultured Microscilla sp.]